MESDSKSASAARKAGTFGQWLRDVVQTQGGRCAIPVYILLLLGFVAPLVMVLAFAFATPRTFTAFTSFTLENFIHIFDGSTSVLMSYVWALTFAALATAILTVVCYPVAVGMVRIFGRRCSMIISVLFCFPLFVSENVRLYGWILFFMKNGILDGTLKMLGGAGPDILYTPGMILFGICYTYLPYMLFPIVLGVALVPQDLLTAARDLGASRFRTWREIELPLAMPGVLIGMLITFVLAAGAISESKILGGQSVVVITNDIDIALTYSQNWPQGSAMAVVLMLVIAAVTLYAFKKIDLEKILGR